MKEKELPGSRDLRIVQTNIWFGFRSMQCLSIVLFEESSASVFNSQEATLGLATVITFACAAPAHESAHEYYSS